MFTKLKAQTAELEVALGKFHADPPSNPTMAHTVTSALTLTATDVEVKLEKLRRKAMLTGDARLYNEKKSSEILLFCADFDRVRAEITEATTITAEAAAVFQKSEQIEAEAAAKAAAEEAETKRVADEAAAAAVAAAEAAAAAVAAEAAAARAAVEFRIKVEKEELARQKVAQATAAAAAEAEAARALHQMDVDRAAAAEADREEADPVPDGFYLSLTIVVESDTSTLLLELPEGDATTVTALKTAIASACANVGVDSILFTGGRRLSNDGWTLRRCRIKRGTVVHVGVPAV